MSYPPAPFNQLVGRVIRQARAVDGRTQTAVAAHLGVDPSAVAHWELGHALPRLDMFVRLADTLGFSLDELREVNA